MNFEESAFLIPNSQHQLNENLQKARKLHDLKACFGKI
jgi:hypothetical protein